MTSRNASPGTAPARCPACDEQLPDRDRSHGGRKARYCSGACKASAYRASRRTRPAEAARTLHHLITKLATLAAVTKPVTKRRPPVISPLFDEDPNNG